METKEFKNVSIILPTLNESFSFNQTVDIILEECEYKYIKEFIAVVCDRTLPESIEAIKRSQKVCEEFGVPLHILYQKRPFAGGAVADGFMKATGSHILMMAPDLETDPHNVKDFIAMGKRYPNDMVTASRWLHKGSFAGYSKIKLILNFFFQKMFAVFYGVKLTDITLKHPFFLETALKPIRLKVKIHEIPSSWAARQEGESQNSLLQTFKYLKIAFKVKFEKRSELIND